MTRNNIILQLLIFVVYLLIQVFFFEDIVLFNRAFCFIYVGFILLLPIEIPLMNLLLLAFVSGLSIDIFYNSLGMHAASILLLAFLRPYWISMITPRGGYEEVFAPTIKEMSFGWFLTYALPLIGIHHFVLFFIEAGGLGNGWFIIIKVLSSTIFSFVILVIAQMLFYPKRRLI